MAEDEMWRVFNCGIGMVVAVGASHARDAADQLRAAGEKVYEIGTVEASSGEPGVLMV